MPPVRTLVVECPDWPLTALGVSSSEPALVLVDGRVVATTASARSAGVIRGQRRSDAQFICPEVRVLERNEAREVRTFEVVASALEVVTPWVEAHRPGRCAFEVRGPLRLCGGETAVVDRTLEAVNDALEDLSEDRTALPCRIGVADGLFAAGLAARVGGTKHPGVVVVPSGGSPAFLSPLHVGMLPASSRGLGDTLIRLGLKTLGAFAALPAADVLGRFGSEGLTAHRLASGLADRPLDCQPPSSDLAVSTLFDPPVDRIDQIAFAARSLAESFHDGLLHRGVVCTRLIIEAETEQGERLSRTWRDEGVLGPAAVSERVRWQLEGWLHAPLATRPTSGLVLLSIAPNEVVPMTSRQLELWGGVSSVDERAFRGCTRLVGLLGPDSIKVPEWSGGRDPDGSVVLTPLEQPKGTVGGGNPSWAGLRDDRPPWPGSLPSPLPAVVHVDPIPVDLVDIDGFSLLVDGRGVLSASPYWLTGEMGFSSGLPVVAWAGPWPVDERWWDERRRRRRARLQVVTEDGAAHLAVLDGGQWLIAATYG